MTLHGQSRNQFSINAHNPYRKTHVQVQTSSLVPCMASRMIRPLAVVGSVLVGYASFHCFRIASRTALPSGTQVSSTNKISDVFASSYAVSVINPQHHITVDDVRSITVSVSDSLCHEQILARFVLGFFGGHVFAAERGALRFLHKELVDFKGRQALGSMLSSQI